MFNLESPLVSPLRTLITESSEIVKGHREALVADMEARCKTLTDDAINRLSKTLLIAASLLASGLFAVAAGLLLGK